MAETSIEWTEQTWNPVVGCSVVSPGCTNCYAMKMAARLDAMGTPRYAGLTKPSKAGPVWTGELRLVDDALTIPLRRRKPTTYFVNSMSDLFHENVPDEWIDRVFAVMALAPQHTFQVLTKRSARMREYLGARAGDWTLHWPDAARKAGALLGDMQTIKELKLPLANVWLGVSAEDQRRADQRVPDLLATPAAVRFVSAEPLLGPIDFEAMPFAEGNPRHQWSALTGQAIMYANGENGHPDFTVRLEKPIKPRLDWIIVGGESGPGARPMHPEWARQIRDACAAAGVAFHFKQHGAWVPEARGSDWMILSADGDLDIPDDRTPDEAAGEVAVTRVGKATAGRLLDGVTHDGFPTALAGRASA